GPAAVCDDGVPRVAAGSRHHVAAEDHALDGAHHETHSVDSDRLRRICGPHVTPPCTSKKWYGCQTQHAVRLLLERGCVVTSVRRLLVETPGPVRRAHQRSGHDTGEADLLGLLAEFHELLRPDPPRDRVVARRRTEVLRDGDELATGLQEVPQ